MPIWDRVPDMSPEDRYEMEISGKLVRALWEGNPEIKSRVKSRNTLLDIIDDLRNSNDPDIVKALDVIIDKPENNPGRGEALKILSNWVKAHVIDAASDNHFLPPAE